MMCESLPYKMPCAFIPSVCVSRYVKSPSSYNLSEGLGCCFHPLLLVCQEIPILFLSLLKW